ncbi:tryptophan halogenase family protein [Pseudoalteromonas rubra]|uniref:tryptophan halogenase family protein n=1 Tax=Pseudoalteromonas rubra TaxID=43658 RepID=UPI000F7861F9|nr:tryptophan halogenase family protein [Pseudoalteromonas rubra]
MQNTGVKELIILGGGTAGWMTAAMLSRIFRDKLSITLVESDEIATIGVGEASIPPLVDFNRGLGLDEREFITRTQATIKLGIEFTGWGSSSAQYMHAFGSIGKRFGFCDFHHVWQHAQQMAEQHGTAKSALWDYSLNYRAAKAGRFAHLPVIPNTRLPGLEYAYHFDAGLYAKLLKEVAQKQGVIRTEGKVTEVKLDQQTGEVSELVMHDGACLSADMFIDCSGLSAMLIDKTLNVGFDDWSHWLACDSAFAIPTEHGDVPLLPYTQSIAHGAGWQWRIPLQHRVGNGLVFASRFCSEAQAREVLLSNLQGKPLDEPRLIRFKTGMRRKQWHKNVFAIGLSSGFLEPLESTSIHLIQSAIMRLIRHFPVSKQPDMQREACNSEFSQEMKQIRDFIILHYKATKRDDTAFWRWCKDMEVPKSLEQRLALFQQSGAVMRDEGNLFSDLAWQQVMLGQGIAPGALHPLALQFSHEQASDLLDSLETLIQHTVDQLPTHQAFINNMTQK